MAVPSMEASFPGDEATCHFAIVRSVDGDEDGDEEMPQEKIALKDINIAKDRIHDSLGVSSSSRNNKEDEDEEGETLDVDLQFAEYTEGVEKYSNELSQSELAIL